MLHLTAQCRYYVYNNAADMRKGFDSLCGLVSACLQHNPLSGAVFIFFNRKRNQVKLLHWEGDGFALYYKRLEKGTYECVHAQHIGQGISITHQQLQLILQGIVLSKVHYRKRYQHQAVVS